MPLDYGEDYRDKLVQMERILKEEEKEEVRLP
jgi:hypothetical protein